MNHESAGTTVMLVGATGLVGQCCLGQLVAQQSISSVRALVRRPFARPQAGKVDVCVADFNQLQSHASWFAVDAVVCALGTTIAKAGSQAGFRQVDFDLPLQIAQLAKEQGARQFVLVSALGADAQSRVFYNRVKGELEQAIKAIGFESVTVAQPSLLKGQRAEFRLAERVSLALTGLVSPLIPATWRPVRAEQVAAGLVDAVVHPKMGWHVLSNPQLLKMH